MPAIIEIPTVVKRLRGGDGQSEWEYSKHDGWVQGYSFEVVVSSTKNSVVFPLLGSADKASVKETQTCRRRSRNCPNR